MRKRKQQSRRRLDDRGAKAIDNSGNVWRMSYYDKLGPLARAVVRDAPYEVHVHKALDELHSYRVNSRRPDSEGFVPPIPAIQFTDQWIADWLKLGIAAGRWCRKLL